MRPKWVCGPPPYPPLSKSTKTRHLGFSNNIAVQNLSPMPAEIAASLSTTFPPPTSCGKHINWLFNENNKNRALSKWVYLILRNLVIGPSLLTLFVCFSGWLSNRGIQLRSRRPRVSISPAFESLDDFRYKIGHSFS